MFLQVQLAIQQVVMKPQNSRCFMKKYIAFLALAFCLVGCSRMNTQQSGEIKAVSYNEGEVVYETADTSITTDDVVMCLDSHTGMMHQLTMDDKDLGDLEDYTYGLVYRMCLINYIAGKYGESDITDYYSNLVLINNALHLNDSAEEHKGKLYLMCFDGYTDSEINEILTADTTELDLSYVSYEEYDISLGIDAIDKYVDSMSDGMSESFHLSEDTSVTYMLIDTAKISIDTIGLDETTVDTDVVTDTLADQLKELAKDFTFDESGFRTTEVNSLNEYITNYNYSSKREDVYEALAKDVQLWE